MKILYHGGPDEGCRHVIGNGGMLAYGVGPNIEYLYGPPYSSPPVLGMKLEPPEPGFSADSVREEGTAIWRHRITDRSGAPIAEITDFMLPDRNVLTRDIEAKAGIRFAIEALPGIRIASNIRRDLVPDAETAILSYTSGPTFLAYDPVTFEVDLLLAAEGSAQLSRGDGNRLIAAVRPGRGRLLFAPGPRFPELLRDAACALADRNGGRLAETAAWWHGFTASRRDFASLVPADHPLRAAMLGAIDSVSVLIKCRQSASGGVMPGHRYSPMAFVCDMAGVFRGLLALGYLHEARAILNLWRRKWERFGDLQNAEGMGDDSVRLSGGNNEVEVPAYTILCIFEYYKKTRGESVLEEMLPLMECGTRALGYDSGLMLYNAVKLNDPIRDALLAKVPGLLDRSGAWAEYYDRDRPADCCRARPWESAMNIEAIAAYIQAVGGGGEGG
jgi:hypothetical protein